jgi:F0F1-type ATP synthase assembly protein I
MKYLLIIGLIAGVVWLARRASAGRAGLDAKSNDQREE